MSIIKSQVFGFPVNMDEADITHAKVQKDGQLHDLIDLLDDPQTDALAGLTPTADSVPYFTSETTAAVTGLTAFARTLLDDANAATARTTLGAATSSVPTEALAGVTPAADTVPYFTGATTAAVTGLTSFARTVLDDADAATARSTLGADDSNNVNFLQSGTGAGTRTVRAKLRDVVNVKDFGAVADGTTDDTVAIQAALDSGASSVVLSNGISVVNGTLIIPPGVTLHGSSVASEYYPAGPGSENTGSTLLKPLATGTAGAIVVLKSGSGLSRCYLKHLKTNGATTGIIQVGLSGANSVYNSHISNVTVYGEATTDLTGVNTCYGIYYPNGEVTPGTYQRYFNRASDFYITNCDVAIRLGANCNANKFTGFITRQCYQHILLDGVASNQQCVENVFTSFSCVNIGALPTSATTVFTLSNYALFNVFSGFTTEANGTAFSIDSTSNYNIFNGNQNEINSSYVRPGGIAGPGAGNLTSTYAPPQSIEQFSNMMLPSLTTGAKYDLSLIGSKQSMIQLISTGDGLPYLDGAGTLVAGANHSRTIIQFNPTVFIKSAEPNFRGKLTVWANGVGTATHMCSVEFGYVVTNSGTNAGLFEVYEVNVTPSAANFISGLYFISGATGTTNMRIAMAGGNLSAAPAGSVAVALDLDVYAPTGYARDTYFQHTFTSTAVTANDVTDAVSMLAVAETAV